MNAVDVAADLWRFWPDTFAERLSRGRWRRYRHLRHTMNVISEMVYSGAGGIVIIEEPVRHGKALALDTPIATPAGWSTMGALQVGDEVFDETGKPCRVTWKSQVWTDRPCYAVKTDDGDVIVADEQHEWPLNLERRCPDTIKTTKQLAKKRRSRAMSRMNGALQLPDAELPIDPYLLGLWLGNGHHKDGALTMNAADIDPARRILAGIGCVFGDRAEADTIAIRGLLVKLKEIGVYGNKHVPALYMRSSPSQRLALLQGLIDSDGYTAPDGQVEFCSTLKHLAESVQELVRSLGRKASLIHGRATLNGVDHGDKWRVMFYMANAARMRKGERCRDAKRTPNRYLEANPCDSVPTQCIEVDSPNHLYLAGLSMTPTHNSESCSMWLPAWFLSTFPERYVLSTSYQHELAESWGRRVRNTLEENEAEIGIKLAQDSRSASVFHTQQGGYMQTAGVGGALTGKGMHLGIVDDSIKNAEEADSETIRAKQIDWFLSTFMTRRMPGCVVVIIMARWHSDDLAGFVQTHPELSKITRVVRLPALAEENDELGRKAGEPLCPELGWTREALLAIKGQIGERWFNALYQQRPTSTEGAEIKRHWWRYYDELPVHPDAMDMKVLTIDATFKDSDGSDFVVMQVWAVYGSFRYLLDVVRARMSFPETLVAILNLHERWRPHATLVEEKANGAAIIATLQQKIPGVVPVNPTSSKESRARAAAPQIEAGNCFLPNGKTFSGELVEECAAFPLGKHDDQVDALSQFLNYMMHHGGAPMTVLQPGDNRWVPPHLLQNLQQRGIQLTQNHKRFL